MRKFLNPVAGRQVQARILVCTQFGIQIMWLVKTLIFLLLVHSAWGWWIFSSTASTDTESGNGKIERRPVAFEINSAEQKFLAEAQQFLDLPQLDQCQHMVISRLRSSCGDMHEEELGKLAVELFNCQSKTEGRPTYTCTQHMTLADCTGTMDPSTWNAYHIISNRARSVCYATRQEHFKRQTEIAVNQLSQSTIQQLSAMRELASSHQEIKTLAHQSLQNMQNQQTELAERQELLATRQDMVRDKISVNLDQLAKERTLIRNGQRQLVNMTDSIKHQLEEASWLLSSQEKNRREGQSEIVQDLTRVKNNIQEVWSKVDEGTGQLLGLMEEISSKYEATLDNLDRINSSVSSMMGLVITMDQAISSQLDWLVGQLGGTQDGLQTLVLLSTHGAFLLLATLAVLFVRAPGFARVALLVLVCGNVFLELQWRVSLTFTALAAVQALLVASNWFYLYLCSRATKPLLITNQPIGSPLNMNPPVRSLPEPVQLIGLEPTWTDLSKLEEINRSSTPTSLDNSQAIETLTHTPTKPLPTHKCTAHTKTGSKCRLPATPGGTKCRRHI